MLSVSELKKVPLQKKRRGEKRRMGGKKRERNEKKKNKEVKEMCFDECIQIVHVHWKPVCVAICIQGVFFFFFHQ